MKYSPLSLLFATLLPFSSFAEPGASITPAPFSSKEELSFVSVQTSELLGLNKTDDFVGVVTREEKADKDLRIFDLYEFKDVKTLRLDKKICDDLFIRVFGNPKEISLKTKETTIFQSRRSGKVCETPVFDEAKTALFKERRLAIVTIKGKTYGMVFRYSKKATPEDSKDLQDFINGLR